MVSEQVTTGLTKLGRVVLKLAIWILLTAGAYKALTFLYFLALPSPILTHSDGLWLKFGCGMIMFALVMYYIILTNRLWRCERFIICW